MPILERNGFEIVDSTQCSPMEIVAALREASVVLSCDDDTLANLVVAPQNARVGVIIPEGIYRARAFFVSGQIGQELTYLIAEPDFGSSGVHSQCDLTLSPEILQSYLEHLKP